MSTQRHEIEARIGDDHGLDDDQVGELMRIADDLIDRFCSPDADCDDPDAARADLIELTADERDAALVTAYRLMRGEENVVDDLRTELISVRRADARVKASLAQAARMVIQPGTRGTDSEAAFARRVGVNRLTVRDWLGK